MRLGWRIAQLGEICTFNYGKALPESARKGGSTPVFGSNGVVGHHDVPITSGRTIVIGRKGSFGEVNYSEVPSWPIDTAYFVDEASTKQDIRWLFHRLGALGLNQMNKAAAVPGLNREDAYRKEVLLPPLDEQRRIAAILDKADALRAKRREALAQLDRLAQSIFVEMFGEPNANPKKWERASVGELSDCIVPGRDKPKSFSGGTPWITTSNLVHLGTTHPPVNGIGLSRMEIEEVRAKIIPAGSVVISCVGDLGIVSLAGVPMVINQQLHSFQCRDKLNGMFLMYCLSFQKPYMLAKASSTTLPYMNKSVCNSIPVIVPPIASQQTFAARIQSVEAQKANHVTALRELDRLFASLQRRVFAGEF